MASVNRHRIRLSEAQNHRCCYCGVEMDISPGPANGKLPDNFCTIEHVDGRSNLWENLAAACFGCNQRRGGRGKGDGLGFSDYRRALRRLIERANMEEASNV